jgi:hypothetical protein
MMSTQISQSEKTICSTLQTRIERLRLEKTRLLDEWSQAMKRAYHVPVCDRQDVLHVVGQRYSDLVDAVESHITILKCCRGEFPPRIEHLLLRTGRQEIH